MRDNLFNRFFNWLTDLGDGLGLGCLVRIAGVAFILTLIFWAICWIVFNR